MAYRDDLQAARMRRDALTRELQQLRSRTEEYQQLVRQEQALAQELAQCARDMDQARARVELPLLQQVRVASPCTERWDSMAGDERVRFCGRCAKNVYDLSALTASQAEALLRERGESMCVRFFRRSDGTVLTSDCPVGEGKRFWRRVTKVAVASGLAAAGITMATIAERESDMAPMPSDSREELGGARPFYGAHSAEMERLDQRIADAEARLAAATEKSAALEQEIHTLRAEARRHRAWLKSARRHEIPEACRKNPLDC